jgi:hypothetical protein
VDTDAWEEGLSMSMTLASTLLFAVTVMNVEADALPYYDPPSPWWPSYSYAFTRGSSILREQGEKLLVMNGEPPVYGTQSVIALVNGKYGKVRDTLRDLVKERWGILTEEDNSLRLISKPSPDIIIRDALDWPMLGEGLGRLRENGALLPISEYQLTSQPYNKVRWINGRSQVVIRVSDGAPVFDTDVTILQVSRTDWAWEWARSSFHGIMPLPWKEYRAAMGIVTSTEIALIEDLKKFMPGLTIRYLVTDGFMFVDDRYGKIIRPKMQEAIEQFSGAP